MKNVIVITGASSGIGKEFAVQLDKTEKADVLLQQRQNFTAILPNAL